MERLIEWYRVGSSYGALIALIVANLIPLVGVLFLGWSVWQILIIYWLENGIVGLFNILKMQKAEGTRLRLDGSTGSTAAPRGMARRRSCRSSACTTASSGWSTACSC